MTRAFRIYDKMLENEKRGIRPLYRPKDWNVTLRRKEKESKKYSWSNRGGHVAPIFIPPTPNSELARALKAIADSEAEAGVHFNVIETGGLSLKAVLQKSNPLGTAGCESPTCLPCKHGKGVGGNCRGCGVNYKIQCQLCPAVYIGESSRNLFTRCQEHLNTFKSEGANSFMKKHQDQDHRGVEPVYTAKVTSLTRDCLTRQVREAVLIRRSQVQVLNSKSEWHQPALFRVQQEIERG